jgi:hypothetical protein
VTTPAARVVLSASSSGHSWMRTSAGRMLSRYSSAVSRSAESSVCTACSAMQRDLIALRRGECDRRVPESRMMPMVAMIQRPGRIKNATRDILPPRARHDRSTRTGSCRAGPSLTGQRSISRSIRRSGATTTRPGRTRCERHGRSGSLQSLQLPAIRNAPRARLARPAGSRLADTCRGPLRGSGNTNRLRAASCRRAARSCLRITSRQGESPC